jgi:hypothetical protein
MHLLHYWENVRPHYHTTWAVIVGVDGNGNFFERSDDASKDGIGEVRGGRRIYSFSRKWSRLNTGRHSFNSYCWQKKNSAPTLVLVGIRTASGRVMRNSRAGAYKVFLATGNIKVA